jgi:hypothetical protein
MMNKQWMIYAGIFLLGVVLAGKARSLPLISKLPSV